MIPLRTWGQQAAVWVDRRLTRERLRRYAVMFLVVWVVGLLAAAAFGHPPRDAFGHVLLPDFLNHWTGGRLLLEGQAGQLYDATAQDLLQDRVVGPDDQLAWFVAPPFAALFYLPFAALPYLPAAIAWAAVSLALLALAARALRPLAPALGGRHWPVVLLVAAASQPVCELIGSGQDSALNLLLWVVGARAAATRRDVLAGLVFALGLHKPQLFFLPPLLFLCWRRWRAVGAWLGAAGLLGGLSLLVAGPDGARAWLAVLASPTYREVVQAGQAWKMQSLPALLAAAAPASLAALAEALGLLLGALLVGAVAWQTSRRPPAGPRQELLVWGLACLTTLLASPHLGLYDLALLLFPAVLLVAHRNDRMIRLALVAAFLLTWTSGLRHGIGSNAPWPLAALGASWSALPLLALWRSLFHLAGGPPLRATREPVQCSHERPADEPHPGPGPRGRQLRDGLERRGRAVGRRLARADAEPARSRR